MADKLGDILIVGTWDTKADRELKVLRAEGYMTSGDIAGKLGINRQYVKHTLGEPDKRLRRGGKLINLWKRERLDGR